MNNHNIYVIHENVNNGGSQTFKSVFFNITPNLWQISK